MPKPSLLQSNLGPPVNIQLRISKDAEDKSRQSRDRRKPRLRESDRRTKVSLVGGFESSLTKIAHSSNLRFQSKNEIKNLSSCEGARSIFKTRTTALESLHTWSKLDLSELDQDDVNNNNKTTKLVLSMRQSNVLLSPRVYDSVNVSSGEAKNYANEGCFLKKSHIQQVTMGPIESDSVCDILFSPQNADDVLESNFRNSNQSEATCHRKPLRNIAHGTVHNELLGKREKPCPFLPNARTPFEANASRTYPEKYPVLQNVSSRWKDDLQRKDGSRKCTPNLLYHPKSTLRTSTIDRKSDENDVVAKQIYEADMEHLINQRFLEGLKASENAFFDGARLIRNQRSRTERSVLVRSEDTLSEADQNSQLSHLSETESNDESIRKENFNSSDSLHVSELNDSMSLETGHHNNSDIDFDDHVSIPTEKSFDYEHRKKQVHFKVPISSSKGIISLKDLGLDPSSEDNKKNNFKVGKKYLNTCEECENLPPNFYHAAMDRRLMSEQSGRNVDRLGPAMISSPVKSKNSKTSYHSANNAGTYGSGFCNTHKQLHRKSAAVPGSLTTSILATRAPPCTGNASRSRNMLDQAGTTNFPKNLSCPMANGNDQSDVLRVLRMKKIVDKTLPKDRCDILLKARYFRKWQQNVRLLKIIRNKETLKIIKAVSFDSLTTTTKHFLAWRTLIGKNKMIAGVLCQHHLMKKGFAALLWSVRARKLKNERVHLSQKKLKFTKYFGRWRKRYQERRFENIQTAFTRWKLAFRNKVIVDMFDKRRNMLMSSQVFYFWKERLIYSSHLRIASEHYNGCAMRKSWQLWKIFAAEKAVLKSQAEVAQIKHETSVLSRCMKRWKQTTIRNQYVKIYCRKKVIACSLADWKHFTSLARIRHQKEILSARNLRKKHLLRHHFSVWIQEMKIKNFRDGVNGKITRNFILIWKAQLQKHRMICAEIQAHHNHTMLKLSFSAISVHRKDCRTRRSQAVHLLQNFTVRRFMWSWRQLTARKAMLRNKQMTYYICGTGKKLQALFQKWRFRLNSILDEQEKQHQWTSHCVRQAADKWLHLLKLKQNETRCEKFIIKLERSRLKRRFGVWRKHVQFEHKLCERAKSSRIVLLRIKMRRILRNWNIRAQESLNMRPLVEKLNRKRLARCFDAFILIRNRQRMKEGMMVQIKWNCLRQSFNEWKHKMDEKNRMELAENQYHTMLTKKSLNGWIKYVSHCQSCKLVLKQHEQSLLLQTFYIWATTMASRQLQASKKLHEEFVRRSNAQFLFQSWRSAAKHRLENEEKDVMRFRKQHDLALKRSFFGIWTSNAIKHTRAKKFASRNTEQRIKIMLLSWHFVTTENLVKKMERFTSSIKSLRKQENLRRSKSVQSEQNVSEAFMQTDNVTISDSVSEKQSCTTSQSILSQSLSTMSETGFSETISKTNHFGTANAFETIPQGVDLRKNSQDCSRCDGHSIASSENLVTRINGCADSGILMRGSTATSEHNSVTLKDQGLPSAVVLTNQSVPGSENDSTNMPTDNRMPSEFELVASSPLIPTIDAESNFSWSSDSSERNLLTVRDLTISHIDDVKSETALDHGSFETGKMPTAYCAQLKESQSEVASHLPEHSCQTNKDIAQPKKISALDQASETLASTPTSPPLNGDPFLNPILQDLSHMSDLPIHIPATQSHIPKLTRTQNQNGENEDSHANSGADFPEENQTNEFFCDSPSINGVEKSNFHDQASPKDDLLSDQIGRGPCLQQNFDEKSVKLENAVRKHRQTSPMKELVSEPRLVVVEESIKKTEVFKPKVICDKDINTELACQNVMWEHDVEEATLSSRDEGVGSDPETSSTLSSSEDESASYLSSDDDVAVVQHNDDVLEPAIKEKPRPMLPIHLHMKYCEISTTEWLVRLAVVRMRYRPLAFAFHQWMLLVRAKKWEQEMIACMNERSNSLAMKKHLRIWHKNHMDLQFSKQHSSHTLLKRYFLRWLMWSKCKKDRKRMRQLAEQKYSISLMKTNFENWNMKLQKRNALLEILKYWQTKTKQHLSPKSKDEKSRERKNNELLLDCFTRWKLQKEQIHMVDRYRKQTILARCLAVWRNWVSRKVAMSKRCEKIVNYRLKKKVLKSWMDHVLFMKNIYMMSTQAKKDFLSLLLSRWHEKTQVKKAHSCALLQLSLVNRTNTARACFNKWKQEQTKHKLADIMHRRSFMKKFVAVWHVVTKERIKNQLVSEAIGARIAKHSKQTTLSTWVYEYQLICKMNSVRQRFAFLTVKSVWCKWRKSIAVQRARRCYSIILKRRTFNCWKRFLQLKQNSDKRARTVLSLWHKMTKRNQNLSCMADQFVAQSHTINLEIHFTTWLIASDQTKRAKTHNRNMILGRAFSALHEQSKQKKKLLRMKNNFMKQRTKELFAISWHKWKHRYRTKQQNLTSIEKHKIATECRILWRCWLLWKRRTMEMNATQIFKKSTIKMCFSKWALLCEKLRKADDLADQHVDRRLKMIFTQWWSQAQTAKNERQIVFALENSRNRISTISIFMIWLKSSRNRMIARCFWEKKNKKKAFMRLRRWKNESKRLKNCYNQALQLVQTISLKFYFNQWKSMFRKVRMLEVTCDEMIGVKSNLTLRMYWKKWFKAKEKRDMHLCHERVLVSQAVAKWKKYASNRVHERLEKERKCSASKQFRNKWLCKRAFTVWKSNHKVQTFALNSQKIMLNMNWNCWKTRTAMIIFAREVNKTWTLRRCWYSWRMEYATRRAIKDGVERINRDLVISVFRIWRAYRCKRKTGRAYQDHVGSPSSGEVLTPRKRSKIPILMKNKNIDC